jgi:hypothetical protein
MHIVSYGAKVGAKFSVENYTHFRRKLNFTLIWTYFSDLTFIYFKTSLIGP